MTTPRQVLGFVSEIFTSFQGEGPRVGERHLFVRLAGCNIRCRYCDTPDSLVRTPRCRIDHVGARREWRDNPLASSALRVLIEAELAAAADTVDAIAITGGEPLVQAQYLAEVLGDTPLPAPVLLEPNGVLPGQLARVIDRIDVVSMDIKPPSNTGEKAFWDEHARFLAIAQQRDVYVKVLVDDTTSGVDIARAARLVAGVAPTIPLILQPISRPEGGVAISGARLAELFDEARRWQAPVRVVPQTHKMIGID